MRDFLTVMFELSEEGFKSGYFISVDSEHMDFYVIHTAKEGQLAVTVCNHDGEHTKYAFRLITRTNAAYEKKVETNEDFEALKSELREKVEMLPQKEKKE